MSDRKEREWLVKLAKSVAAGLRRAPMPDDFIVTAISSMKAWDTDTDGWYVSAGRIRGDRAGEFQIWLDRWTRAPGRRVCFCYKSLDPARVRALGKAGVADFGRPTVWTDSVYGPVKRGGPYALVRSLPKRLYAKPILELYGKVYRKWCFYSVYVDAAPRFDSEPAESLAQRGSDFFLTVASALEVMSVLNGAEDGFPVEVSSAKRRSHIHRERSSALARLAKRRDAYICRICGFSFSRCYGGLGRGFAEAHHVEAVASLKEGARVTLAGLLTVCANCHRMLHRLGGGTAAVAKLRRVVSEKRRE